MNYYDKMERLLSVPNSVRIALSFGGSIKSFFDRIQRRKYSRILSKETYLQISALFCNPDGTLPFILQQKYKKRNSGYRSIGCKSPFSPPRFLVLNKAGLFKAYRESEKSTNLSFLEVIRVNCTKTTKIISLTI